MRLDERRLGPWSLVAGAALFLVANLIHPKEYATGDGNEPEQLAEIAEHYTRWQVAHFLTFISIFFLAVAVAGLALLLYRRDPRIGLAGGVLGIAGAMGLVGVLALDGFAWGIAGEVWGRLPDDRLAAEQVLEDLQNSEWSLPFYLTPLAWIIGMVVLALGLWRTGLVPAWAGWALAAGSLAVGLEAAINSNAYFIAASTAFLVGAVVVAVTLRGEPVEPAAAPA